MTPLPLLEPQRVAAYPKAVRKLIQAADRYEYGPGVPRLAVRAALEELDSRQIVGQKLLDETAARACLAGLWLLHNFLDESHKISQTIHDTNGSFWHGIMHRREPDYENAKYWFRSVGSHPVLEQLAGRLIQWHETDNLAEQMRVHATGTALPPADALQNLAQCVVRRSTFDPLAFVDVCQRAAQTHSMWQAWCRWVSWLEWQLLFDHCYQQAVGCG